MKASKVLGVVFSAVIAATALTSTAEAAEYRWSCRTVPAGYTYVMVRADVGCEPLYLVTLPEPGLWACRVPAGWTYTATRYSTSCWWDQTQYQLAKA
ncbi:hypothetical protein [Actinokineospora diospyrosa]|uniref:Secreted protein n=1 Tax=Actinokineospora diospyrosa TaxID=103728 RepID=A0ABT1IDZ6_9PSEU|nr:hypothetical protein [Actinokineospora diospyrosa]MCP2270845.1 hypothetical protein [Actinokineospora diospyrosa]